jgi:hypothetical protein
LTRRHEGDFLAQPPVLLGHLRRRPVIALAGVGEASRIVGVGGGTGICWRYGRTVRKRGGLHHTYSPIMASCRSLNDSCPRTSGET